MINKNCKWYSGDLSVGEFLIKILVRNYVFSCRFVKPAHRLNIFLSLRLRCSLGFDFSSNVQEMEYILLCKQSGYFQWWSRSLICLLFTVFATKYKAITLKFKANFRDNLFINSEMFLQKCCLDRWEFTSLKFTHKLKPGHFLRNCNYWGQVSMKAFSPHNYAKTMLCWLL